MHQEEIARSFDVLPERQAKIAGLLGLDHDMHSYCKPVQSDEVYCICRTNDTSTFMICCDECNEWYHGRCINITEKQAAGIKQYFCDACREKDSSLEIAYNIKKDKVKKDKTWKKYKDSKSSEKKTLSGKNKAPRSLRRCGECTNCYRTYDCGRCDFCKDMRKFGGPNKIRQKCRQRQCLNFGLVIGQQKVLPEKHKRRGSDCSDGFLSESRVLSAEEDFISENLILKEISKHQENEYELKHKKSSSKSKHSSSKKYKDKERRKSKSSSRHKTSKHWGDSDRERRHHSLRGRGSIGPNQCYGPGCTQAARSESKYCSDECGLRLAFNRMYEILPQRIQQWNSTPCAAEMRNRQQLEIIRKQQQEASQVLEDLNYRSKSLEAMITRVKQHMVNSDDELTDGEEETEMSVYCVTCGHEVSARIALRHMEKCFNKYESQTSFGSAFMTKIEGSSVFCDVYNPQQRTYCKRLRVLCPEHCKDPKIGDREVCGCPLTTNVFEETNEFCRIPKRKCVKHYVWEKLRRAEIDTERVRQWLRLDELFEQERTIRTSMSNRAGVLGLMLHSSVNHDLLAPQQISQDSSS